MSHTPGPWKWEGDPGHSSLVGPAADDDYVLLWVPYEGLSVMGRLETTGWAGTKKANARLIAAAPELLDALQRLIATGLNEWEYQKLMSDPKHYARAAIAKATGGKACGAAALGAMVRGSGR